MMVRALCCLACAAVAVCIPAITRGEGQSDGGTSAVALEYSAAPGCADVNDFKAIVIGRLGYDVFRGDAKDRVLVHITSRGNAFEGHIERRNAEGRWAGDRTFPSRSEDCGELGHAMAFALALQIQLSARAATPAPVKPAVATESATTAEPATSPIPAALPSPPVPVVPKAPPAPTIEMASPHLAPQLAIGAGGLLGLGMSSRAALVGRVFGSVAWQHTSLELAAEVGWPTTTRREDGAGFSQQLLVIGAAGCENFKPWSACLVAKAGTLRILGKDVDKPRALWGPILESGLRLGVQQPLGRYFFVTAKAEGLVNVTRWRISLDQSLVWTAPRFAATLGFDIGVRILQSAVSNHANAQDGGGDGGGRDD